METDHLHEYVKLAQCGSFTATARDLHLTQSTLSKHIAALEREFGAELFVRDRNGAKLTQAGNVLYQQALKIDRLIGQTHTMVRAAQFDATDRTISYTDATKDTALRCACTHLAKHYGLNQKETGALILYLEERMLSDIQEELDLTRDEIGQLLGSVYRKLGATSKQEVLDLIHSVSE